MLRVAASWTLWLMAGIALAADPVYPPANFAAVAPPGSAGYTPPPSFVPVSYPGPAAQDYIPPPLPANPGAYPHPSKPYTPPPDPPPVFPPAYPPQAYPPLTAPEYAPPAFAPANPYLPPPTSGLPPTQGQDVLVPPSPGAEEIGLLEEDRPWWDQINWHDPIPYDTSVELGLNGSSGNADAFSLRAGGTGKLEDARTITEFKITYAKTTKGGVLAQDNGLATGKYEWLFPESSWSLYTKSLVEYDGFKAWDVRLVTNAGVGYHFFRTDNLKFAVRAGAGVSREVGGPADEPIPESVFGVEFTYKPSPKFKFAAKSEYFPAFGDFSDFRVVSDVSWEMLLDQYTNMSLKFLIIDRYDSTPHGKLPNDVDYTALLIWKL